MYRFACKCMPARELSFTVYRSIETWAGTIVMQSTASPTATSADAEPAQRYSRGGTSVSGYAPPEMAQQRSEGGTAVGAYEPPDPYTPHGTAHGVYDSYRAPSWRQRSSTEEAAGGTAAEEPDDDPGLLSRDTRDRSSFGTGFELRLPADWSGRRARTSLMRPPTTWPAGRRAP